LIVNLSKFVHLKLEVANLECWHATLDFKRQGLGRVGVFCLWLSSLRLCGRYRGDLADKEINLTKQADLPLQPIVFNSPRRQGISP
jgi:hypothetical protein